MDIENKAGDTETIRCKVHQGRALSSMGTKLHTNFKKG